jgi:soluble lytic murein transglycosylase-like protein
MLRRCCSSVFAIGVLTLSCGEGKPGDGAGGALAQVEALPPVSAKAEDESRVAVQLREFLQRQRSSFTQREIRELAHVIAEESAHHRLDPQLVLAVIYVESRFDCFAVSPVGALGLMQIMPATGRELAKRLGIPWNGPLTLFDPIVNVRIGTAYVRQLTDRYGSVRTALAAYNWGPGYVDRQLREGTPVPAVYPGLVFSAYDQKVALRKSQAS